MDERARRHVFTAALVAWTIGVSVVVLVATLQSWNDCEVGLNASTRLVEVLLIAAPKLALAQLTAGAIVLALARSLPFARRATAHALIALLVCYAFWCIVSTPAAYPSPLCAANAPPWWPSWVPC